MIEEGSPRGGHSWNDHHQNSNFTDAKKLMPTPKKSNICKRNFQPFYILLFYLMSSDRLTLCRSVQTEPLMPLWKQKSISSYSRAHYQISREAVWRLTDSEWRSETDAFEHWRAHVITERIIVLPTIICTRHLDSTTQPSKKNHTPVMQLFVSWNEVYPAIRAQKYVINYLMSIFTT